MRHSRTETPPGRAVNEQDGVKKVNTAPERVAIGQTSHITIYNTKNIKKYYYVNHGHERPDSDALGMLDGL